MLLVWDLVVCSSLKSQVRFSKFQFRWVNLAYSKQIKKFINDLIQFMFSIQWKLNSWAGIAKTLKTSTYSRFYCFILIVRFI